MNVITVNRRDFTIKAKQLRRSGIVPGSVFGGSLTDSVSLQLNSDKIDLQVAADEVILRIIEKSAL